MKLKFKMINNNNRELRHRKILFNSNWNSKMTFNYNFNGYKKINLKHKKVLEILTIKCKKHMIFWMKLKWEALIIDFKWF